LMPRKKNIMANLLNQILIVLGIIGCDEEGY